MTTKYHVCWGPNAVAFVEVPDGSDFQTGQPNDEIFEIRDDAARRAFELGYSGFKPFKLRDHYENGEYAIFYGNDLYRALAEIEPYDLDPSGHWQPPYPNRDRNHWILVTVPVDPDRPEVGPGVASKKRARNSDGTYKANDPTTQTNEAWAE